MTNVILTKDQQNAVDDFVEFLANDDPYLCIQGAAGTGKSFLIKHLLHSYYSKYAATCLLLQKPVRSFDIYMTATTNKAVAVLDSFIKDPSVTVSTIYSLLGLQVTNNYKTGKSELTPNKKKQNVFAKYGVMNHKSPLVFIDESSFISEELQSYIDNNIPPAIGAKIVYIGDKYQLAPVGQQSSVMDTLQCSKVILSEIVRNAGHILKTGTQFRETVETGVFKPIQYNQMDIVHMNGEQFQHAVEQSFNHPDWNTSVSKVLAWTNDKVQAYNQHIRTTMQLPKLFNIGEVAITNEYIRSANGKYSCNVDSEVVVTKVLDQIELFNVKGYLVELDHSYISFMPEHYSDARAAMKEFAANKDWKPYFEIKENWLDLRAVYASSIHKSQGSTYQTVFLDLSDIGANWNAMDVARLLYVGITRAAKQVVCYGYLPDRYT